MSFEVKMWTDRKKKASWSSMSERPKAWKLRKKFSTSKGQVLPEFDVSCV